MTNDLFLAILAMDAYNRTGGGTSRGLVLPPSTEVGVATLDQVAEDTGTSFFAQSYIWNGHQVISYRGTDSVLDAVYGFPVGGGDYTAAQARLAAQSPKSTSLNDWSSDVSNITVSFPGST
jgi:hypothetical protein